MSPNSKYQSRGEHTFIFYLLESSKMKKLLLFLSLNALFLILYTRRSLALPPDFTPTPEIIKPQSSMFCTDYQFSSYSQSTREEMLTPTPTVAGVEGTSSETETVNGKLKMNKEEAPDYSTMEENFASALDKLMPQDLKDIMSIENPPLNAQARHFVGKRDENNQYVPPDKNSKIPETSITYSSWLASLLGETKILCGVFGTCKAPKSPIIKIQQPIAKVGYSNYQSTCLPTTISQKGSSAGLTAPEGKDSFDTLLTRTIETIIEATKKIITTTEKSDKMEDRTRGQLAGGNTLRQQSNFLSSFLPSEFIKGNYTLAGDSEFETKINGKDVQIDGGNPNQVQFKNQGVVQKQRCLHLCSLYPSGFDIRSIDPLCPPNPCDNNSYPQGQGSMDDPVLNMSSCQKLPDGSCDYAVPGDHPRCDGDPICESGKCYPLMYRQAKDYTNQGCPVPYPATDCNDPAVCQKITFEKNPEGGFGSCQYSNPDVCVRTDREDIDNCAALCNWACCAFSSGD